MCAVSVFSIKGHVTSILKANLSTFRTVINSVQSLFSTLNKSEVTHTDFKATVAGDNDMADENKAGMHTAQCTVRFSILTNGLFTTIRLSHFTFPTHFIIIYVEELD